MEFKQLWRYRWLLLAAPLSVGVEVPEDSSSTMVRIVGGGGSYSIVPRDCEGRPLSKESHDYANVTLDIHHNTRGELEFGLRGGVLQGYLEPGDVFVHETFVYINPYVSFEFHPLGFGGGLLASEKTPVQAEPQDGNRWRFYPSMHLRLGPPRMHFLGTFLEGAPLYTTGVAQFGFGSQSRGHCVFVGLGTPGPYDHVGFVFNMDIAVSRRFQLNLVGRAGSSEGEFEGGAGVGLSYLWQHGR